MNPSIQSTLPRFFISGNSSDTPRFSNSGFSETLSRENTSQPSTIVKISEAAFKESAGQVVQNGSFSPKMIAIKSQADDENLNKYLKNVVYEDSSVPGDGAGGLLDLTDYMNGGPIRYSKTGEPVTSESNAYFNKTEQAYRAQKISIYETELSKGTDLREIFNRLAEMTAQQPERFLAMKGYTA